MNKYLNKALELGIHYGALIAFTIFTCFPFFWAVSVGLSEDPSNIWLFPRSFLPTDPGFMWFERVFREIQFVTYLKNSLWISGMTVIMTVIVSILAGYPLARLRFPGRGLIFVAIIATLMLPSEVAIVPNFVTLKHLGDWSEAVLGFKLTGLNTYSGAYLPYVAQAFGIFLMKQAFEQVPQDLIDAARVDGAKELTILWRVMVPVSAPSIAALAIFALVNAWNEFLWTGIVLQDREKLPLAVGMLYDLTGPFATSTSMVMAGIVLSIVPVLIFFAFTQRYFISGLDGAVK